MPSPKTIILSRTDNLGDVVLTLPMAGFLKERVPGACVYFIGKAYTRALIESSHYIDGFLDREALLNDPTLLAAVGADAIIFVFPDRALAKVAAQVKIPLRIGTGHRWFHWWYANRRVDLSRRNSDQHEAQLNLQLLRPLGLNPAVALASLPPWYGLSLIPPGPPPDWRVPGKFHLVLHPKSKGSAREWPLDDYYALAQQLSAAKYQLIITGTADEGALIQAQKPALFALPHVRDLTGKLSLAQLIGLIDQVDGLVACSTGPLHIAAALGKYALGIYPPMRPLHPGRWAPVGVRASYLCLAKVCNECRKTQQCACIRAITVAQVRQAVVQWQTALGDGNLASLP